MSIGTVVNVMRSGIFQIFILILPVLSAALIIGLIVAIFQATTSIQEQTLTFLPKLIVILLVLALLSGWMFSELRDYTVKLFEMIPELAK
ncbi:MAG: flagellar biosynthesis protein FliQ [Treponema porcinum]|uniref:Flagellar biosynthetic protein FliQ n=1 Tax=Treponema porcinum TaxID=261392 RepID=A0A1T4M6A9_TREPO|nr:flagellar biosynthesis protein FliQ [Treponema porcinum]MCI6180011.1 flagellar biosynthesis protein FliQ [Treponema porcinum]MCI6322388.1 flagellar biosynthesis protein FliQ [Treponema porcinum]MCI6722449.1 flagellar biosynthesis protein FliQ [Treponema porcinum]MCI6815057.1 flagellar biosynthesis protein FliQ [Treponema porcinum]MCI7080209.1 flagellar biosynthesis protein FliQ [Treponema porcinum]